MSIYETKTFQPLRYLLDYQVVDEKQLHLKITQIVSDSYIPRDEDVLWETQFYINGEAYHFDVLRKIIVGISELLYPDDKEAEREVKRAFFQSSGARGFVKCGQEHHLESGMFLWRKSRPLITEKDLKEKLEPEFCLLSPYYPKEGYLLCGFMITFELKKDCVGLVVSESDEINRGENILYEEDISCKDNFSTIEYLQAISDQMYGALLWEPTQKAILPVLSEDGTVYKSLSLFFHMPSKVLSQKKKMIPKMMKAEGEKLRVHLSRL